MILSNDQLEELINKYEKKIRNLVWCYKSKSNRNYSYDDVDDLVSECMLVFMDYVNKLEDPFDEKLLLKQFPYYDMKSAMTRFTLSEAPVHFPRRTSEFKKYIGKTSRCFSDIYDMESSIECQDNEIENLVYDCTLDDFFGTLSDRDKLILKMRMDGKSFTYISKVALVSRPGARKIMERIKKQYLNYIN